MCTVVSKFCKCIALVDVEKYLNLVYICIGIILVAVCMVSVDYMMDTSERKGIWGPVITCVCYPRSMSGI